ncbi:hypothetical protein BH09PSE2_BH09PSE2_06930 [soil metagenome]
MTATAPRPATIADLDVICAQREAIFLETGCTTDVVARFSEPSRDWHAERLADGRYRGWLTEAQGAPVAGVGLTFWTGRPAPPTPTPTGAASC